MPGPQARAAARAGIWHKAGMVVVVLVWYIFTELGSIAENAAAMGAPVPGWLVRILAQGKEEAEK